MFDGNLLWISQILVLIFEVHVDVTKMYIVYVGRDKQARNGSGSPTSSRIFSQCHE